MSGADNVYWAFSAAAQTVAAFVAFLLAGYALVHAMMEAAAQADETLVDIHEELKTEYHRQLSLIAVVTAASILSCLSVVLLNAYSVPWFGALLAVAASLTTGSVVGAVVFVIRIVDPKKYRKAAKRLAQEVEPTKGTRLSASSAEFFTRFIELERVLRALWERRAFSERIGRRQGPPSFREILDALLLAQALSGDLYERLIKINRYRNLVFHGHVHDVDRGILAALEQSLTDTMRVSGAV